MDPLPPLPEPLWLLERYRALTLRMIYSGEVQMDQDDKDQLEQLGRITQSAIRRHKNARRNHNALLHAY